MNEFRVNNQEVLDLIEAWEPRISILNENDVAVRRNIQNRK